MNAVNAVLLFIMVWTFSPVCQAAGDVVDDFSVSCDDVTGTVGNEVHFTCSVSLRNTECCIRHYNFKYPEIYNKPEICKENSPVNPCDQRNSFTCSYTPTKAMTETFRFFVQTKCGQKKTNLNVVITESSLRKAEDPEDTQSKDAESKVTGSKDAIITPLVGLFVILILIIILMTIICKKQSFGFQRRMFPCFKHDDDNSYCPENVI